MYRYLNNLSAKYTILELLFIPKLNEKSGKLQIQNYFILRFVKKKSMKYTCCTCKLNEFASLSTSEISLLVFTGFFFGCYMIRVFRILQYFASG